MGLMTRRHLCAPIAPLWVSLLLLLLLGRSSGQPSCARWTQSGGGWTCSYIASLYGQTVGALQALNPGLDCTGTAPVPLNTLICVQGVLAPPAATAGPVTAVPLGAAVQPPPLQPPQPPPPPMPPAPQVTPFVVPAVAPLPVTSGSPIVTPAAAVISRPASSPAIAPAATAVTQGPAAGGGAPPPSLPPAPASPPPPPPANASGAATAVPTPCVGLLLASWDQCGGSICMAATRQQQPGGRCSDSPWLGVCCPFGHSCIRQNDWYWQCRSPESGNTSTAGRAPPPPPPAPGAAGAVATPPPPPPPTATSVPAVAGDGATDAETDDGSGNSGERRLQLSVQGNGTDLPLGTTVSVSAVLVAPLGAPLLNQPVTFTLTSSNGSEWAVTVPTNLFGSATTSLRSTEEATVEVAASVINQGQLVLADDLVYVNWMPGPGQAQPPPPPLTPPPPPPARPPPPVRQQPPAPPAAQQLLMSVLNDGVAAAGQAAQVQVLYLSGGVGVPRADVLLTVSNDANGIERAFSGTTDDTGLATISVPSTAVTLPGSGPVVATLRASTTSNSGDIVLSRPLPGTKPSITWKAATAAAPPPPPPTMLAQRPPPPPPLPPPGPATSSRPPPPTLSSSNAPPAAPPGPAAPSSSSGSSSMAPSQTPAQAVPGVSTDKGCDAGCRLCAVADRKCLSCSPGFQSYGGRCGCAPGRGGSQCQACAVGTFSGGGSSTQLFPACSPCPEGYSTRAPGAAVPADCAVCATAAGYTCQTCVPVGGGSTPGRAAAGAGAPPGRRRRLLARRLVQYSNFDGVPACYEYAQFDTVASERCDGLAARTNLTVAQLQALNPLLNCNSTLLRGSMCVSVTCPSGFGGPAGPNCTPCSVGTWSSGDYDPRSPLGAPCLTCPTGYATSRPQATAASDCTGCAAGFYCSSCVR